MPNNTCSTSHCFQKKMYVQDLMRKQGAAIYRDIIEKRGHLYVSGHAALADGAQQAVEEILHKHGKMSQEHVENLIANLKVFKCNSCLYVTFIFLMISGISMVFCSFKPNHVEIYEQCALVMPLFS